ncbi:MAG: glycoside hydrolase family 31 protein [Candidatus Melainabacteria bacterium]|jgi:alpha-glucosidase|nr:glycoside hydrolase family 31 protein [Candidatus Melainabacteria bacterium]
MPSENTQYGLKNRLILSSIEEAGSNLYTLSLNHINGANVFLHICFISEDMVRFHYSNDDDFDLYHPNTHIEFRNFEDLEVSTSLRVEDEAIQCIDSKELVVKIHPDPLQVQIFNQAGDLLSSDEPGLGFWSEALDYSTGLLRSARNDEIRCYKQYKTTPYIYGLGDKTGSLNRWGRRFRNAPLDALGYDSEFTDPLYKDIPFFIELNPETQKAHGIFFDNFNPKFFDFGRERKPSPYYYFGADSGDLNYYFINGPQIKDVVSQYLELTGKPMPVPSFTFGYLASGMSYTENSRAQEGADKLLIDTFKRFKDKNIPASAFHLSSGYIQDSNGQRQQFIWNKDKFPDPKAFAEQAKELGVELCANVKPVLLTTHPLYEEAAQLKLFIDSIAGETLIVDYWGGQGSYLDFRKPQTQTWWKEKLKTEILDNGICGIWNDNNEYEIFQPHQAQGHEMEMSLIMAKLSHEAGASWILSRSGYSGIQKYAQTWTGDNNSSWKSLQYDNTILASMGLSGLIHAGCDIGGFWGETPDSELLLRWIQNGVFTPRFCIHSYKDIPTEPDLHEVTHPKHFKSIQKFMQLRTELIPYLEEQSKLASEQGIPIMRPTVYDFQDEPETYNQSFEYIFGDKFFIAPIYQPECTSREFYLPGKGITWTHYFTKEEYQGGQQISLDIGLEDIPVFTRD